MDARSRSRGNSLEHLAWNLAIKIIAKFFCIWNFYDEKVAPQKVSFGRFCTNRSHMLVREISIFVSKLLWNKLSEPWTRFAHNWSIYKVLWPQLQTLFNISNSFWRHNCPESSAFVTKKVQFCKIKVGVRYKKGETDVRVRDQGSPGSCTRDDQCLEDFFEENSLKQLQLI